MNTAKERIAIKRLKAFEPHDEPYRLCYSGGKDSDVIRILARLAGVKHDIVHNLTTVDAPETVWYVKSIPDVIIEPPTDTMWDLIAKKGFPPTRIARYCCEELKERGGDGRVKITGVRWAESVSRKVNGGLVKIIGKPKTTQKEAEERNLEYAVNPKGGLVLNDDNDDNRRFIESCYRTRSVLVNPIVDWTDDDVWEYLRHYGCESNPLYACGENRIGCIGCPMQGFERMKRDFAKHPKYRANYVRAFDRMLKNRRERRLEISAAWHDGEHVMRWWTGDDPMQISLFDDIDREYLDEHAYLFGYRGV